MWPWKLVLRCCGTCGEVLSVADESCILWGISVFEVYPLVGMVWEVISGCKAALEFEVTV